jgi:hypothetical protein
MVVRIAMAARHRLENEHNGRAWLAWHIAVLPKQRRMPRLDTLTVKRSVRSQTWQEQMTICRMITVYHGGTVNG